jgi:uncharacterized Ntn-hydrolase superfamily protein
MHEGRRITNGSLPVATFSIVGFDPKTGDLGIAVQSRFLAVGSVVPWAQAGVGAIAVQSFPDPRQGPLALQMMADGSGATQTLTELMESDEGRSVRQIGAVDSSGRSACYTGSDCLGWAGHVAGDNFAAQGNMLVSERTVGAMAEKFQSASGTLAARLMAALAAAQSAGGDSRGKQSAALLVVRDKGGFLGFGDRYMDLRVDDHPDPITELGRLVELQRTMHLCVESRRLAAEGKIEEAVDTIEQAGKREPGNVNVLYFLARTYTIAGRRKDAEAALALAYTIHPNIELLTKQDKLLDSSG